MSKSLKGTKTISRKLAYLRTKNKVTGKMVEEDQESFFSHKKRIKPYVRSHQPKIIWKERCYGD